MLRLSRVAVRLFVQVGRQNRDVKHMDVHSNGTDRPVVGLAELTQSDGGDMLPARSIAQVTL